MNNRFNMKLDENIAYAKRNMVDSLYKTARLEGIAVTFPQTNELYEGRSVAGLSVDDVVKINNLKTGWRFILESIDYPMDFKYIKQLNQYVMASLHPLSGILRTTDVKVTGTSYVPDIPTTQLINEGVSRVLTIDNPTERAISLMLYIMRAQMFYDGNKRTAQLAANQIMIQNGCGIIAIPVERQMEFVELLIKFYESNDNRDIIEFVYDTSIDGYNRSFQQDFILEEEYDNEEFTR